MMRQAGRYLPEYQEIRKKAGSFLDLCYTPHLASLVTLQPIRRFGFDAAILFSDILVVPHALGQDVTFIEGEGPKLSPITDIHQFSRLREDVDLGRISLVYETIERVRSLLSPETALIGFCGAPWTVASYMVAGKSTVDQAPARLLLYQNPEFFSLLINRLVEASITYLTGQIRAGVDVLQIFESFAGALPPSLFDTWSLSPIKRIISGVKKVYPHIPIIVFSRGAGLNLQKMVDEEWIDALGLDWSLDPEWVKEYVQNKKVVQGNLDPLALVAGGRVLDEAIDRILFAFAGKPHIFNLGHGVLPQTPISHVEQMMKRVRAF